VTPPTQQLSHALGDPADPSRHMSVPSPVTTPLAQSSGHGLSGNKSPSPQGDKGKEPMETDNNDRGHLQYILELDNVVDELPHSRFVVTDHDLALEGDKMHEDWPHISAIPLVSSSPQRDKDKDAMETDEVNSVRYLGQPTTILIEMSSPRGREASAEPNDGQASKMCGAMEGPVMDSAMQIEEACLDDLGDVPSQEHSLQVTKARKRTPKKSPPVGNSKSERRHKALATYSYGSQDPPK